MRFTVFKNNVPVSFVCDGEIAPISTNDKKDYVKGVFAKEATGLVFNFQQGIDECVECELEDDKFIMKGRYVSFSKIDKSPMIIVEEKIVK